MEPSTQIVPYRFSFEEPIEIFEEPKEINRSWSRSRKDHAFQIGPGVDRR